MIQEGKCYRIVKKDEELLDQFPEFKIGAEFKVIHILANAYGNGVVSVQFRDGTYVDIRHSRNSWFWCFYRVGDIDDEGSLVEIEEQANSPIKSMAQLGVMNGEKVTDLIKQRFDDPRYNGFARTLDEQTIKYIESLEAALEQNSRKF